MEKVRVTVCDNHRCREDGISLITEEPLLIRVDDTPYSVVMRTPGEEIPHAAGFCLAEGLVGKMEDFATIGFCKDLDPNVVEVRLKPERREKVRDILGRRGFVSQTSCGICGKELVEDLYQILTPMDDPFRMDFANISVCVDQLIDNQVMYTQTRGAHASLIVDSRLDSLAFAEDVGRHNALDKAIGKAMLGGRLDSAKVAVLSSRISYELVQKVARAQIPVVISFSRPTALAVEMGKKLNLTLICAAKSSERILFCGEHRLIAS